MINHSVNLFGPAAVQSLLWKKMYNFTLWVICVMTFCATHLVGNGITMATNPLSNCCTGQVPINNTHMQKAFLFCFLKLFTWKNNLSFVSLTFHVASLVVFNSLWTLNHSHVCCKSDWPLKHEDTDSLLTEYLMIGCKTSKVEQSYIFT